MIDENSRAIEMLKENKLLAAQLYRSYAVRFPEYGPFWIGIASEEVMHANAIDTFYKKFQEGVVYLKGERFNLRPLEILQDFINEKIAEEKSGNLIPTRALTAGYDIESSAIQRRFFEAFATDSEEVKSSMEYLLSSTEERISKIKNKIEEHKLNNKGL